MQLHKVSIMAFPLLLLVTACGGSDTPAGDPPKIERTADGDVVAYPDLQHPRPTRWAEAQAADESSKTVVDQTHVRIKFSNPLDPTCLRHDVSVDETADAVTITLFVGDIPNASKLCPPGEIQDMYAHFDTMLIETQAPIGDRAIVDGAPEPDEN